MISTLRAIVGADYVISRPEQRLVYECDAFTLIRRAPGLVVLPNSVEQVSAVVRLLSSHNIPFVPRGAGTGLAGGTVAHDDTVMIGLNRMNRIRRIDPRNRIAEVEAGLINARLSKCVAADHLHFAPDPSSQAACTIGGNLATNAGGPHTLKYGVTVNHVLGVELVQPDGEILRVGGPAEDLPGLDLTGLVVGSEGTFGIITAAIVRLTPEPPAVRTILAVFDSIDDATQTVSDIIAAGILPAAMEMMDHGVIQAVEAAFHVGLPLDAAAVLIIEIDGPDELSGMNPTQSPDESCGEIPTRSTESVVPSYPKGDLAGPNPKSKFQNPKSALDRALREITAICHKNRSRSLRVAADADERALIWKSRKRAAGAFGRLTTSYCTQDGVVPRSALPDMLREIADIARRQRLRVANLVHAGDGNIHPILMYDENNPDEVRRVLAASHEILASCIRRGGTVTGEHGIGVEKIDFVSMQFSPADLRVMSTLRRVFDPRMLCNPGKLLPDSKRCWEIQSPGKRVIV